MNQLVSSGQTILLRQILLDQSDKESIGGQSAGQQAQCAFGREAIAELLRRRGR